MITREHVIEAYVRQLGRPPESEERITKCMSEFGNLTDLRHAIRNSPEYRQRGATQLKELLSNTDSYQDIYSFPNLSASHGRETLDRCRTIERFFLDILGAGAIGHISLIDVGCAQGFVSFYFADRGAHSIGIDYNWHNTAFCRELAVTSGIDALFINENFSEKTLETVDSYGVNTVFLLSVLHHVIKDRGIDWVKSVIKDLLDRGCVLICELACHDEPVPFDWRETLPQSELEIFPSDCVIHHLGRFSAMNGLATRPLYAIHRSKITYNEKARVGDRFKDLISIDAPSFKFSSVCSVPVRTKSYQTGPLAFAKTIRLSAQGRVELLRAATSEIMVSEQLSLLEVGPSFLGYYYDKRSVTLVYAKVEGVDLTQFAEAHHLQERRLLAVKIAVLIRKVFDAGLYWNDCREHNILVDSEGRPILIDFEMVSPIPFEDDRRRARWMLWHLVHSQEFAAEMTNASSLPTELLPEVPDRSNIKEWSVVAEAIGV